ncbi:hypothetical protein Goklo_021547 [Gossypium klotzschianum]|uniref:Uncharacterized protein n=1 Tax=Gossypium klotzschianum TaxID=34286 RepID=A0A7J8UWG9_9ROSI|nr:hypothetical protein [Gossypium klotzschianum]
MEEDDYDDGDGSYGEEEDDEKAGFLSLLNKGMLVRTSILSKNWRYLWGSVSALDFDDTLLFNPNKGGFHGIGGVNFINFVDRVLIRNSESPTHMFGLCCVFNLNSIEFSRSSSTKNLFLSFAALEELIAYCKNNDDGYDSSDEEYAIYWAGNGNAFTDYEIVVDAPKLEVLRYKGYVASGCSFENCISVARAVIDMLRCKHFGFACI